MKHHRVKGFTLIELLVVIAIIAILAAILFPVFAQAREKARAASCLSNTKQVSLSLMMYTQDYDERYVLNNQGFWQSDAKGSYLNTWIELLAPYIKNVQVWVCPDASASSGLYTSYGRTASGYILNQVYWADANLGQLFEHSINGAPAIIASVDAPATTVFAADGGACPTTTYNGTTMNGTQWDPEQLVNDGGIYVQPTATPYPVIRCVYQGAIIGRHNGGANVSWMDGHSKFMRIDSLGKVNSAGQLIYFIKSGDKSGS